jgi:hypothetical protein
MTKYNSAIHALNEMIAKQFSESPSIRPLYERFGQATLPSNKVSLSDRFVDLDVLLTTGEVLAKDEFNSLGGVETIAKSGRIKAKLFDEPINIPKLAAREILQGGDTAEGIKFRKSLTDGQDALLRKIVTWITAGPTIATDKDYDPDWHAPLAARNTTTETIADPQDMSIAAGTDTDSSTVNFWGAGKTVESLEEKE